jgi:hypothetical protein
MKRWQIAVISLAVVVAFFLLREHWGHMFGLAPYLLLLACPLLHLLHPHHHHHGGVSSGDAKRP